MPTQKRFWIIAGLAVWFVFGGLEDLLVMQALRDSNLLTGKEESLLMASAVLSGLVGVLLLSSMKLGSWVAFAGVIGCMALVVTEAWAIVNSPQQLVPSSLNWGLRSALIAHTFAAFGALAVWGFLRVTEPLPGDLDDAE